MLDLLKTATAVFYQLICRNASLQVLFCLCFKWGGFATVTRHAMQACPGSDKMVRSSSTALTAVVFVAEIGHGRKGPVSQQIRAPCYLNGHEGVLRGGDVLLSASACGAIRSYDPIRCQEPQWPRRPLAIGRRGLPLNPSRSAPGMSSTPSAQSHIRGYRSGGPQSSPSAGFPKSVEAHAEGSARTAK